MRLEKLQKSFQNIKSPKKPELSCFSEKHIFRKTRGGNKIHSPAPLAFLGLKAVTLAKFPIFKDKSPSN